MRLGLRSKKIRPFQSKFARALFRFPSPKNAADFPGNPVFRDSAPPSAKIGAALGPLLKDRAPCARSAKRKIERKKGRREKEREKEKKQERRKQGDDGSKKKGGGGKKKQERKTQERKTKERRTKEENGRAERGLGAHIPTRPFFRSFGGELFAHFWLTARRGVRFPRVS